MQAALFLFVINVLGGPSEAEIAGAPTPATTAFTYQGQLKRNGVPVNGLIDGRFSLWGHPTSTDPTDRAGEIVSIGSIAVANGLFTVALDFGTAAFNGDARWLQVEIRENGDPNGPYTTLVPREPVTPSPYSLQTRGIFVDPSGLVGIGTQNPEAQLEVASAGGDGVLISGGDQQTLAFADADGIIARVSSFHGDLAFRPDGLFGDPLVVMLGDGNGKVGIGKADPATKLDVQGSWDGENGPLTLRGGDATLRLIQNNCANAFGNCTWILHMGTSGNLEFSRKTGPTTWTPVMSLTQFGETDIGLEVMQSGFLPTPAQISCPAGKKLISGGCWCSGNLGASQPNGNGWFCECRSGTTAYAYAFCARVK